jgi:hypothetical protein
MAGGCVAAGLSRCSAQAPDVAGQRVVVVQASGAGQPFPRLAGSERA